MHKRVLQVLILVAFEDFPLESMPRQLKMSCWHLKHALHVAKFNKTIVFNTLPKFS
jgi:hypothetical protein